MAKILVVDDERDLGYLLGAILRLKGHEVIPVFDGYQAIEEVKTTHYDLIMMDIRLPGINGVEAFIQIKEIDPGVKVIMMTGFAVEGLIEESLQQGAYACIHKPFDLEKVIAVVEQVLKENKKVVLIANGDSQTRDKVREALTEKGYRIVTAVDAEDVYVKLKNNHCHCILVNLQLPGMNGLKILKEAKKLHPNVVVIVMANCDLPEMVRDAEQLSVYGYIKKPVDIDELMRLLKDANV